MVVWHALGGTPPWACSLADLCPLKRFWKSGHKSHFVRFRRERMAIIMTALFVRSGHKGGGWGLGAGGMARTAGATTCRAGGKLA